MARNASSWANNPSDPAKRRKIHCCPSAIFSLRVSISTRRCPSRGPVGVGGIVSIFTICTQAVVRCRTYTPTVQCIHASYKINTPFDRKVPNDLIVITSSRASQLPAP